MRKPIIVGNWKMNKTNAETLDFLQAVNPYVHDQATFGIGVPYTALATASQKAEGLIVAAQNCHYAAAGAFTGEVSIPMLAELGVNWCIIGHSERRQMFNETDETVNLKAHELLKQGFSPIICCGETLAQFEAGETASVVEKQITACLAGIDATDLAKVVIAYEPIWAIGTGKNATKEIAQTTCQLVRKTIAKLYDSEVAEKVRVQYGGSVKPENILEYLNEPDIDGALIGGASLTSESFIAIMQALK